VKIYMGVNLSGIIPAKEIEINSLRGKKIAIDALNTLYQFLSSIRDKYTGEPLRDSNGKVTSHLSGLFYRTLRLVEAGIEPVYIFDGKPPEFKHGVIEERKKIREEAEKKWKAAVEAGEVEKIKMYAQGAARMTEEMLDESKKLLDALGIPWVQAPSEGEAQAAFMAGKGVVWACGSQDWDSLLFGAGRLVRNLTITGRRKMPGKEQYIEIMPEIIELEKVLSELGINREQLIILGMLVGTDYNPKGIKGVGPKTALKIVKEHKTLDSVLKHVEWNADVSADIVFNFFKSPPAGDLEIKGGKMDEGKIREIMVGQHDFSEDRIVSAVKRLKENKQGLGKFLR
jgi:flap endonuclease-1